MTTYEIFHDVSSFGADLIDNFLVEAETPEQAEEIALSKGCPRRGGEVLTYTQYQDRTGEVWTGHKGEMEVVAL